MFLLALTSLLSMVTVISAQDVPINTVTVSANTVFELYTNRSFERERLWPTRTGALPYSRYNPCAKVIIMVEGASTGKDSTFMIELIRTLTAVSNYNVVLVNYNNYPYISSVPIAGGQIATFLRALYYYYNVNPIHMVLYGFSLGVHVAAYASRQFRIGRLIGRLGSFLNKVGHVNFVLDGGKVQNGCNMFNSTCSHLRARDFVIDSLTNCRFTFTKCSSYRAFRMGLCANNAKLTYSFGLSPLNAPRDGSSYYYDTTSSRRPFCSSSDQPASRINVNLC